MQENERKEKQQNPYLSQEGYSRLERRRREAARRRKRRKKVVFLLCALILMVAFPVWFLKLKTTHKQISTSIAKKVESSGIVGNVPKKAMPKTENPPVVLAPNDKAKDTLVFLGFGDMTFDRQVAAMIKSKGVQEPFTGVKAVFKTGDIVCGNLECPLSIRGRGIANKEFTFRGPPEAAGGMKNAGVNMVSVANNHILDYGNDALADTINILDQNGIAHAGAGMNSEQAYSPTIVNIKGKKIAFLAYSAVVPEGFWASAKRPGIASTRIKWNRIEGAIRAAARDNDCVIVSFHWGVERDNNPKEYQTDLAKMAIDAGADIVIGHHPHVIQGIQVYNNKLIAYCSGNFIFEHDDSKAGEAYILRATLDKHAVTKAEVIPVRIDYNGKPSIAKGNDAKSILGQLKSLSQSLGTTIDVDKDTAEVKLK